jgi:cell division protein FtsB
MALTPAAGRRLVVGAVSMVAVYYALWGGEYSAFDLRRLRKERVEMEARLADTRAALDTLRSYEGLLERDPATIERVARERFGMVREGEVLYRFVELQGGEESPGRSASAP